MVIVWGASPTAAAFVGVSDAFVVDTRTGATHSEITAFVGVSDAFVVDTRTVGVHMGISNAFEVDTRSGDGFGIDVSLHGVLTDAETGLGVSCAAVELTPASGPPVAAVADANGRYFFEPLPPGPYAVRILAPGYETGVPDDLELGEDETKVLDFVLEPGLFMAEITGRIKDAETGEPLVGVFVEVFINGVFYADTFSCGDGRYAFPVEPGAAKLEGAQVRLRFSSPNYLDEDLTVEGVDLAAGTTVNAAMNKAVLGISAITGVVWTPLKEGGTEVLEGARITVRGPLSASTHTDGEGLYMLDGLLDGLYTLTASAPGFSGQVRQRTLAPGAVAEASFRLDPAEDDMLGDVNGDGVVNAVDVQLVINAALGVAIDQSYNPDINGDGVINAVDVQLVINAALGIAI